MTELKINKDFNSETSYFLLREEIEKAKHEVQIEICNLQLRLERAMSKLILQVALVVCATHGAATLLNQILK